MPRREHRGAGDATRPGPSPPVASAIAWRTFSGRRGTETERFPAVDVARKPTRVARASISQSPSAIYAVGVGPGEDGEPEGSGAAVPVGSWGCGAWVGGRAGGCGPKRGGGAGAGAVADDGLGSQR